MPPKMKVTMTPCPKNKRSIAWMAAGVLETADAERLRAHLETCPGCRRYWESMSALSERLNSAQLPSAELTESFHRRIARKIQEHEKAAPFFISAVQALWSERRLAAISLGIALAIATLVWLQSFYRDQDRASPQVSIKKIGELPTEAALPPTLGSYHRAADVSLENFDALLAKQITPKSSTVETFTVSSLLAGSFED